MSMPSSAARLRPVAAVAALVLGLGLGGCANYDTLEPYQPAAGVQTDAPGMKVRNLMVISEGGQMHLAGTLIADQDDELKKVSGVALKQSGDPAGDLAIRSSAVTMPSLTRVNLADSKMAVTGDVKAGGMTKLQLEFAKAAPVTLQVPVVDATAAGFVSASATPGK